MVAVLEIENILWLGVSLVTALAGYLVFKYYYYSVITIGIGLPSMLIGVCGILFKSYEIFYTVFKPSLIKNKCNFCKS